MTEAEAIIIANNAGKRLRELKSERDAYKHELLRQLEYWERVARDSNGGIHMGMDCSKEP